MKNTVVPEIEQIIKNNLQLNVLNIKDENMDELLKRNFSTSMFNKLKIASRPFTINFSNTIIKRDENGNVTTTLPQVVPEGPLGDKIRNQALELYKLEKA